MKEKLPKLKKYQINLTRTTHSGYFKLNCYEVSYDRYQGGQTKPHSREALVAKNSIGALLYDPNRKAIALIEQFRIAPSAHQNLHQPIQQENPWQLEVVAGTIDGDEKVEETLKREIKEESGLEMLESEYIGSYYLCPGYSTEKMHAFCARIDLNHYQEFAGLESEDEDIAIRLFKYDELKELTKNVSIFPTLALLQWFILNKLKI